MQITLNYSELYGVVERSLSIIAKRSVDEKGNRLFTDITLGSRETEIVTDYIKQAAVHLATETAAAITGGTINGITLTFPSNHNTALDVFIQQACRDYCVSYSLYSWFVVTAPRISEKYLSDCTLHIADIIRLTNEKVAPKGTTDIFSTSTSVT